MAIKNKTKKKLPKGVEVKVLDEEEAKTIEEIKELKRKMTEEAKLQLNNMGGKK